MENNPGLVNEKLKDTNVGDTLNSLYIGGFKEKNIYSSHLKGLIEEYSEDTHLIQLVKIFVQLRRIFVIWQLMRLCR